MTQLTPPVTTATGTLSKVYRKESMKKKPRGIAKNFLKGSSRAEDQQDVAQNPPGGKQTSRPSAPDLKVGAQGNVGAFGSKPNFIKEEQARRQGTTEQGQAGGPTHDAGGGGRAGGSPQAHVEGGPPRVERAKKGTKPPSGIDEAITEGETAFNAQIAHRTKMIRDGRKRTVPKGHLSGD